MPPRSSAIDPERIQWESAGREILPEQVRYLYANSGVGVGVSIVAATLLGYLQWRYIPDRVILGWWLYMIVVAASRHALARRYRHTSPQGADAGRWRTAFAVAAGFAGAGWGAAGILLYPQAHLANQVFLIFVIGGMILGAAFLLAPRPEAFLAFLIPTGLVPSVRLLLHGDQTHLAMGLLATVFTLAALITTGRIHRTIDSLLRLQFENRKLVDDLEAAKDQTQALNQALELRVQERTAELNESNTHLRAEIRQREQMEEELLRARKLESLGVLAGGIAHDFNNFLTVVQGNIELAKARMRPGDPVLEILRQSSNACERAAFLASQLLTFAKGGAPVRRVVSIARLVTDAVQLARAGAPTSITVDIARDLWPAHVDAGQIGQVLHNILVNARQAMPEGGIIEVRAENVLLPNTPDADPCVRISIQDYGCGIPAGMLPRIFDPYFTTKPGGSGLGLATAHAIVAKHGGHIFVESEPGEGTVVTLDLPASRQGLEPQPSTITQTQPGTERVLVMDDEDALRNLLQTVLRNLGYEVQSARDGAEAIALYETAKAAGTPFDAVILDLTVSGGMGGLEAAAKLREMDPSAKLIVSSGYSDAPVMSKFAEYGFDAVIPKPWATADVAGVLRSVLIADPDREID
jgi:signal transduction histidine kinase/ActR/RegA family two-component response regulator